MKRENHFLSTNIVASSSLIVARILYGVNWFNVAAIFPLIAKDFERDVTLLGFISAAFFIGVGVFQIPAGVFAAKFTARTSAIFGIALSSIAALLYGFSLDASQLIWLRLVVGAGMAFFFSSGVTLIARYGRARSSGFSIGLMNSAHSIGGIIGIFGWIFVAQLVGWRPSLILSGGIGLLSMVFMVIAIPRRRLSGELASREVSAAPLSNHSAQQRSSQGLKKIDVWKVLSNGPLIALGLVLTGIQAAWALMLTFIIVYLQSLTISLQLTGAIASLALISAIVSAPLIGGLYDRKMAAKRILLFSGFGISISLASMATQNLLIIIISVITIGFLSGGAFTVAYAKARKMVIIFHDIPQQNDRKDMEHIKSNKEKQEEKKLSDFTTLNVAWINGLSLLGVVWMPLIFSFAVKFWGGYSTAWLLSAILTALFTIIPLQKL
jgi:MFS family permease